MRRRPEDFPGESFEILPSKSLLCLPLMSWLTADLTDMRSRKVEITVSGQGDPAHAAESGRLPSSGRGQAVVFLARESGQPGRSARNSAAGTKRSRLMRHGTNFQARARTT